MEWKRRLELGELSGADQHGEAPCIRYQGRGDREDGGEAFHGAQGDHVIRVCGQGLGASILYIDVGQCKSADHLTEEGGLLVVGFDERERDVGRPEFDGEAGESGTGAQVGNSRSLHHRGQRGTRRSVGIARPSQR